MTLPVPFFQIISKQLRIVGSFRYGTGDYEFAISLAERGLVDLKPLVTQRYEFDDALAAFEATKAGKGPDGKVRSVGTSTEALVLTLPCSPSSSVSSTHPSNRVGHSRFYGHSESRFGIMQSSWLSVFLVSARLLILSR
jgi:L-iditol 2-dehydrogenase/D-xylulose reductase